MMISLAKNFGGWVCEPKIGNGVRVREIWKNYGNFFEIFVVDLEFFKKDGGK